MVDLSIVFCRFIRGHIDDFKTISLLKPPMEIHCEYNGKAPKDANNVFPGWFFGDLPWIYLFQ